MDQLQDYVRDNLRTYSVAEVRSALVHAGWNEADVNDAIAQEQATLLRDHKEAKQRMLIGAPLAILTGIAVIALIPFSLTFLTQLSTAFPPLLSLQGAGADVVGLLVGIGILIGGLLALKGKPVGGALVIVLSLISFIFGGTFILTLIGLVAGILSIKGH